MKKSLFVLCIFSQFFMCFLHGVSENTFLGRYNHLKSEYVKHPRKYRSRLIKGKIPFLGTKRFQLFLEQQKKELGVFNILDEISSLQREYLTRDLIFIFEKLINNEIKAEGLETLFANAIENNHAELVKVLLKHGISVDTNILGQSAIVYAMSYSAFDVVQVLLEHNADTDVNNHSLLALILGEVVFADDEKLPRLLDLAKTAIKNGSDIFNDDVVQEFEFFLFDREKKEFVLNLVNYVLRGYVTDQQLKENGFIFLQLSAAFHDKELFDYLVKKGVDVKAVNNFGTVLHVLFGTQAPNKFTQDLAEYFIKKGVNVNATDYEGETALHYLLLNCSINEYTLPLLKLLVESGANLAATNSEGKNIAHILLSMCEHKQEEYSTPYFKEILHYLYGQSYLDPSYLSIHDKTKTEAGKDDKNVLHQLLSTWQDYQDED